jgi:hypothetical protein
MRALFPITGIGRIVTEWSPIAPTIGVRTAPAPTPTGTPMPTTRIETFLRTIDLIVNYNSY